MRSRRTHRTREVAYEVSISVPQGQWPVFVLPATVRGNAT